MFDDLIAQNWRFNATLEQGAALLAQLSAGNYTNCFLAANQVSAGQALMIPQNAGQSPAGAPWLDPSNDLISMQVPANLPIYLQVWVPTDPDGKPLANYYDVAGVLREIKNGSTLKGALT